MQSSGKGVLGQYWLSNVGGAEGRGIPIFQVMSDAI